MADNNDKNKSNAPITFILSEDSVNESGFRILTEGIDIKHFKKNNVMLFMHYRFGEYSRPQILPIGIWVNIRKEDGKLLADAEFDEDDEFAMKIASKVRKKHLKAASIGIKSIEISTDPKHLLKGQTRPSIIKSKAMEASIVDIPRNQNCLRLSMGEDIGESEYIELGSKDGIQKMDKILPLIKSKNTIKMDILKIVKSHLKLAEDANEAQILAAITAIETKGIQATQEIETLKAEIATLKGAEQKNKCESLIDKAIADKKLTASQRDSWLKLAEGDYDNTVAVLDSMKGFTSLSSQIESSATADTTLSDADMYEKKWKAGELLSWKEQNKEEFERCENAYYEVE